MKVRFTKICKRKVLQLRFSLISRKSLCEQLGDVKANPKDFYRYINSQKKSAQGIPPLKKRNGSGVAQSESEEASELNGQFTGVFTKSEYSQVPLLDRSAPLRKILLLLGKELQNF